MNPKSLLTRSVELDPHFHMDPGEGSSQKDCDSGNKIPVEPVNGSSNMETSMGCGIVEEAGHMQVDGIHAD